MTDDLDGTSMRAALDDALTEAPHLKRDRAMIALAYRYADLIDDALDRADQAEDDEQARDFARMVAVIAKIGPRLEAALNAMGMSPGARPATRNGGEHGTAPDPGSVALDQLTGAGGAPAGVDYAAAVDPSVTEADAGD